MTPTTTRTATGGGVTLVVPDSWEQVAVPGTQLALAGPPEVVTAGGSTFRPSITVLVADASPGADIRTLGTEAVAAAHVVAQDGQVLAYDLWPVDDEACGRRLQFVYQQGEVPLCVVQWIILRNGLVTTLTGTCAVAQVLAVHQLFEDVAALALAPRRDR